MAMAIHCFWLLLMALNRRTRFFPRRSRLMHQRPQPTPSYLFTVRLWWEDLGQGQTELRGIVKLVSSGEEHYFRDWGALKEVMVSMVANPREDEQIAWCEAINQPVT